jgi:hypothetical protein
VSVEGELKRHKIEYTYETTSLNYYKKVGRAVCHECGSKETFKEAWYTPDFFISTGVILETKGKFTPADRAKMIAVRDLHPTLDIRMVFMRDNKISRVSETRYSTWAEANGFLYSIGTELPAAWIKEFKSQ